MTKEKTYCGHQEVYYAEPEGEEEDSHFGERIR
jgi:hypothetical protein